MSLNGLRFGGEHKTPPSKGDLALGCSLLIGTILAIISILGILAYSI